MWLSSNPTFRRKTVRDQVLELGDPNLVTFLIKSTFERCQISLDCPARGLIVDRCVFRECAIHARKQQCDQQWFTSTFERCRFTGRYPGCEFGFRIDLHGKTRGTVSHCDFREAVLDCVTFNNCELDSLALPRWPHFTLVDPAAVADRIPNPLDCPELGALKAVAAERAPITRGITYHAPTLLRRSRYTEDQLHEVLSGIEGILL